MPASVSRPGRVVVVDAGMPGLATAWFLQERGARHGSGEGAGRRRIVVGQRGLDLPPPSPLRSPIRRCSGTASGRR